MIRRSCWLAGACVLLAASSLQAQENPRRANPRKRAPPTEIERERLRFALPDDSLRAPAVDTTALVDVQARRDSLSSRGFPERDSLFRALTRRAGFEVIEYRGREMSLLTARQSLRLGGDAQMNRGEQVLVADTIRYIGDNRFMWARGHIRLASGDRADQEIRSDSVLYYDVDRLRGTIFDAESQFSQGGVTWRVFGDVIPASQDTLFANRSAFTSCDLSNPHYTFRAGHLKIVAQNVIVAWPVVLYVANVPVFWLPFFAQDIRPGRRSGILPPRFGFNDIIRTSDGVRRQISDFGYYWAISPYLDAQTTVDWFSGNYTRLNGAFRYRFLKKFIRGSMTASRTFGSTGNNTALAVVHDQELGLNTTLRASARYVKDSRLLQDRSFDPNLQTQTIDSDIGVTHRTSAVNISASARRQQFLSTDNRIEAIFPALNLSFSPVTLFSGRRGRGGLTWRGALRFNRRTTTKNLGDDQRSTTANLTSGFTLASFNLQTSADFDDLHVDALDPSNPDVTPRTIARWRSSADYQVNLMGSTRFRPSFMIDGGWFKSTATGRDFVALPSRPAVGASLATDVYGFYPGFGPFTRIRHKISPRLTWSYAPAVVVDPDLQSLPSFPVASGLARNLLRIDLRQTFEAKVRPRPATADAPADEKRRPRDLSRARQGPEERFKGKIPPVDRLRLLADSAADQPFDRLLPDSAGVGAADSAGVPARPDSVLAVAVDSAAAARAPSELESPSGPLRRDIERSLVLLAINSSGLQFDFERAKRGEPALITEQLTNSFTSDLLRSLTLQMTHDLFEGSGADRDFKPFLSRLSASFSVASSGLGGLARGGQPGPRDSFLDQRLDSRDELRRLTPRPEPSSLRVDRSWNLSLSYSLLRVRPTESGQKRQTLEWNLRFHPTPNWAVRWSTQYNFTDKEFGQQFITLDRDLHRWLASFQFARSPNGNVLFQVLLQLRDAPELKIDYNQRTDPPLR